MGCFSSKAKSDKNTNFMFTSLCEHSAAINCMAWSSLHSVIATGSDDKTGRLWGFVSENNMECYAILSGHSGYITCVQIWEDVVVTGSVDKTIMKWDIQSGNNLGVIKGHEGAIFKLACTGTLIFSASYDRTARCWDFETGQELRVFRGHRNAVMTLLFMPADESICDLSLGPDVDKDILITGSTDGTARTWDLHTAWNMNIFLGHSSAITCMAVDYSGCVLFTGSADTTIRSWNVYTAMPIRLFEGHTKSVLCIQVRNEKGLIGL